MWLGQVHRRTISQLFVDVEKRISWNTFRLRRTTVHLDVGTATNDAKTESWMAKRTGSWALSMPS